MDLFIILSAIELHVACSYRAMLPIDHSANSVHTYRADSKAKWCSSTNGIPTIAAPRSQSWADRANGLYNPPCFPTNKTPCMKCTKNMRFTLRHISNAMCNELEAFRSRSHYSSQPFNPKHTCMPRFTPCARNHFEWLSTSMIYVIIFGRNNGNRARAK